jgi:CheY-like chemotaxis protein
VEPVSILLVDDDIASQRALKSVLDSEGWRVRMVPKASVALAELATGAWNLAIVNVAMAGLDEPLFAILKELAQAQAGTGRNAAPDGPPRKRIRILFLVPLLMAKDVQPILEREGLPHSPKPYHLHDFLERVSELLLESGAITEPIRGVGGFTERRVRRDQRFGPGTRSGAMFASRDDYQMTEEEMSEFERQEEEEQRKKKKEKVPGSGVI